MRRWIGLTLALLLIPLFAPHVTLAQSERCFPETGFCISGTIRTYWEKHGGLAAFGYPIAAQGQETIENWTGTTQWFERDRLEDHGKAGVLAGRLGARKLEIEGRPWEGLPKVTSADAGCRFFAETGHSVCQPFLGYWQKNGGLARFGYPISQPADESVGTWKGNVQWFERRRMEVHAEMPKSPILLGLLGSEVHASSGVTPTPTPTTPPTEPTTPPTEPTPAPTAPPLPPPSYDGCVTPPDAATAPNFPVNIVRVDKINEIVTLQNMTGDPVDLTGWHMCSIKGNQEHGGIGGTLAPWEAKDFPHPDPETIWSNDKKDDGALYNANGQLVSYWNDPQP